MRDLGPWDPVDRPPVWVLHNGQWAEGRLIQWLPPGTALRYTLEDGWVGVAQWFVPDGSWLQHQFAVPERWLADRGQPAPEVPEGEVGFLPPEGPAPS